jgi:hypothetical protein
MFSILHISDLHRSPEDPIGNDELLSTLLADRDKYGYEDPPVPVPDAIVVSGDLIQGVPVGPADFQGEIGQQYEAAADFLDRLSNEFVDGDRSRVVIVPGNHDVCWNTAFQAMRAIDPGPDVVLSARTFGPDTDLRWNWRERKVYEIADREIYERRFDDYRNFLDNFYAGVALAYDIGEYPYLDLFELNDGRIGIAGFNSCAGNDSFSRHGAIPESAIAQGHMRLRNKSASYDLLMAVWHHNVEGGPYASDYMDVEAVYRLIGKGFRLGLHGHQHRSQITHRTISLPERSPMAIVSAGSLCAGSKELPPGVNRQYNILEFQDDLGGVRIHVREMSVATVFAQGRRPEFGGLSYVDLTWGNERVEEAREARVRTQVFEAERMISEGAFESAASILATLPLEADSYGRRLLVKAIQEGQLWDHALTSLNPPKNPDELFLLVDASRALGSPLDDAVIGQLGTSLAMEAGQIAELVARNSARGVMRSE